MALIYKYAIELRDIASEKFGTHISITDNCAGQFFNLDKPMTPEFKAFLTDFLAKTKQEPVFWDDRSFSVKNIDYGSGKPDPHSISI